MTVSIITALSFALATGAFGPQAPPTQVSPKPAQQAVKPPAGSAPPGAKAAPPSTSQPAAQQAGAPAKPGAAPAKPPQTAPSPRPASSAAGSGRLSLIAFVSDPAGKPLAEVKVIAIGPVAREGSSDRDGVARLTALRAGTYRLRFESKDTIAFEREVVLKAGPANELEVTLNPAAPQAPASVAPALPLPSAPEAVPSVPPGEYRFELLSLPDWIERNYIGRSDPMKDGLVGESAGAMARVLQVRDPIKGRLSDNTDELVYVIAGDGVVTLGGRQENVTAGWLVVIPRGTPSAIERRGRNPLILLVVTAPPKR